MNAASLSLTFGWWGMLAGILSGAVIGLKFHRETWLGGYGSFPRRLVRLGHISFFGLGLLQLGYGLTLASGQVTQTSGSLALGGTVAFIVAQATMPLFCFLTAWRKPCRHGFPVPVLAATIGVICAIRLLASS
ncbi:MAG: hypothetical protein KDM64_09565 [Verrucomicrobiae bacterium]|nr:hypothetical protein [Verrucomicrobiae bacterium]MCB1090440.1 hypothetical protein [Verrucomicrobiae bacterium]